jgi:release factor glutamine methyltransferase
MGEALTLRNAFTATARRLHEGRIETPELDARLLLCHAAGLTHEGFVARAGDLLAPEAQTGLEQAIDRRLAGEPVSRIVGMREFYGRAFLVGPHTLDPRSDTETLIDAALALITQDGRRDRPLDILDLGTGTGCILVTLLAELPNARGTATDISTDALAVAAENARRHDVAGRAAFLAAHWLDSIEGQFDLIVSNPPYLSGDEMTTLSPEVAHDPWAALDGGADGLDAYRRIALGARTLLRDGGALLLEIGASQASPVGSILAEAGIVLEEQPVMRDLAGRPRCVVAKASQPARVKDGSPRKFGLENGDVQVRFGPTTDISRPSALVRARPVATATRADFS